MNKTVSILLLVIVLLALSVGAYVINGSKSKAPNSDTKAADQNGNQDLLGGILDSINPLTIESLRNGNYPGSDLKIEQTLDAGSNYSGYVASYISEGNKIYGLLTIPTGTKPSGGWPVIIFNHGFIQPAQYRTTERYVAYQDGFARSGYITFKSDYRGHGSSEGQASGAYGSNGYTVDVLNAVATLKKYKDSDPKRIGMWGHSMGGYITLRVMVASKDVKAGVIWGGVVGSYDDLLNNWRRRNTNITPPPSSGAGRGWRQALVEEFGEPKDNPTFWNSISANSYLKDISGPLQLDHGEKDTSVPVAFSEKLDKQLKAEGKISELYTYPGDDHNISNNFNLAEQRSIEFFDKYLK